MVPVATAIGLPGSRVHSISVVPVSPTVTTRFSIARPPMSGSMVRAAGWPGSVAATVTVTMFSLKPSADTGAP